MKNSNIIKQKKYETETDILKYILSSHVDRIYAKFFYDEMSDSVYSVKYKIIMNELVRDEIWS